MMQFLQMPVKFIAGCLCPRAYEHDRSCGCRRTVLLNSWNVPCCRCVSRAHLFNNRALLGKAGVAGPNCKTVELAGTAGVAIAGFIQNWH